MAETATDARPQTGQVEQRTAPVTDTLQVDGPRLRGRIPYGVESRDMGGWREVIEPGALRGARLDDLVATVDHVGLPIGRHPRTLELEDRGDALHWSVELPESRADVREAVERGDLRAGSWRMIVGRDEWIDDVRHVHEIAELRDVAVVTDPAYPEARAEWRNAPEHTETSTAAEPQENNMDTDTHTDAPEAVEDRTEARGGLQVEDRADTSRPAGLTEAFRREGWPAERAEVPFGEFRSLTLASGTTTSDLAPSQQTGVALGADERGAYPVFPRVAVESGVTSVNVVRQTARALATAANVIRDIDATSVKPETGSEVAIVPTALHQVATKQSGIPNVYLQTQAVATIIENDLRLAINDGLDKLVLDALATAGNVDPTGTSTLVAIRKAITAIQAAGYAPDTLILDPATAEALDTLVAETGSELYVFGPGQPAGSIFGLNKRVSAGAPAPVVCDSKSVGRLYTSPVGLQRFEENDGGTNTSLVRLELHALFGVERVGAAARIAAA